QGLTRIGDLMTATSTMPGRQASETTKSELSSRNSKTTGLQKLDPQLAKLIGAAHGGIGPCRQLDIAPSYTVPLEEPVAARVARRMSECMRRQGVSSLPEP